jgi:hypothetical protein
MPENLTVLIAEDETDTGVRPAVNNYEQAFAHEERQRRLGYLHQADPLFGLPQVALTWRHVTELGLANNA